MTVTFGIPGEIPMDWTPRDEISKQQLVAEVGYCFEWLSAAEGTKWANAEAAIESVASQIFDGEQVDISGYSALPATVYLELTGSDSGGLSAGGAELTRVCRHKGLRELTWASPDGASASTVFDVLVAVQVLQFDDQDELENRRIYAVTMYCKPWPRSTDLVLVPGIAPAPADPTETVVDDGSSAAAWTTTSRMVSRVNLIPNPSFETGASTWSKGAGAGTWSLVSNKTLTGAAGTYSLRVNATSEGVSWINGPSIAVTAGDSVTVQARIWQKPMATKRKILAGGNWTWEDSEVSRYTPRVKIRFYNASGNVLSDTNTDGPDDFTAATVTRTIVAPAKAVSMRVFVGTASGDGGDYAQDQGQWFADKVMVEKAAAVGSYFDGSTADTDTDTYAWTGRSNASPSVALEAAAVAVAGGVAVSAYLRQPIALSRAGAVDTSLEPYVRVTGSITGTTAAAATITLGGQKPTVRSDNGNTFTAYWYVGTSGLDTLDLVATTSGSSSTEYNGALTVTEVATASGLPLLGTGRQTMQTIACYGTMPAEAQVTIDNGGSIATNALGEHTIVYTRPSNPSLASPPLRAYRTAGPTAAADPDSLSGYTETLGTTWDDTFTATIEVDALEPSTYLLAAMLAGTALVAGTSYTLTWQAYVVDSTTAGAAVPGSTISGSRVIKATDATYPNQPTELGMMTLPPRVVEASGSYEASVVIQIRASAGTWTLDEAWPFDVDNGQLSIISTTEEFNRLDITAASADQPRQRYLVTATADDGSTITREAQPAAWARHLFDPAASAQRTVDLFVANTAATPNMSVSASYYPRWDIYAAPVDDTDLDSNTAAA